MKYKVKEQAPQILKEFMKKNKLTRPKFCKLCGITTETLDKITYNKNKEIFVLNSTTCKICDFTGIDFENLFE